MTVLQSKKIKQLKAEVEKLRAKKRAEEKAEEKTCCLFFCDRPRRARDLCIEHYNQAMRGVDLSRHKKIPQWRKTITGNTYQAIKARCYYPEHNSYKDYGGRGIQMCHRWMQSFNNFYVDMGARPEGTSIDRIDVNGHYSCGKCKQCKKHGWGANCRWATAKVQANNKRKRSSPTIIIAAGKTI